MSSPRSASGPDPDDGGLLSPSEVALLIDRYELSMAATYHRRDMNEQSIFELFARRLPPNRDWLLAAGLGPTLRLVQEMRFGQRELAYLESIGFRRRFLDYLAEFRFTGDIEALPEGTIFFANEPLVRVTAPRIEAQLLETLLLNQLNFQTMIATKAARLVLAAGGGEPGAGDSVVDFSPRRDHGLDAAMKVARSSAVAGCGGTSNVASAMRYGLTAVGTMAHSFVLSFERETDAFEAFMEEFPDATTMLVDTYDTEQGIVNAIQAAQATGVKLGAVRLDSGDLATLSRHARALLDEAGFDETRIVASGDLEEGRIAAFVAEGVPIDLWGVGTDLGTSRDSPVVNGVYKLVADRAGTGWRGVRKLSPHKETRPGPKQVFRRFAAGKMTGDVIAAADETLEGEPLLIAAMRDGRPVHSESLEAIRERTAAQLAALAPALRGTAGGPTAPYPVEWSERLTFEAA
jgi:nicotinate phosphoribosyltransferase